MNKLKTFSILTFTLIIFFSSKISASENAGSFLRRGFGAKSAGMGGAYLTLCEDSSSVYWNPANLVNLRRENSISSMYTNRFNLDINNHFLAYARKINNEKRILDAFGIGITAVITPDIPKTERDSTTNRIITTSHSFKDSQGALFLSAAKNITKKFSIGTTLKLIQHKLDKNTAKGVSSDIGLLFKMNKDLVLGLNLQDIIGVDIKWNSESSHKDKIPLNIKAGISFAIMKENLLIAFDINKRKNRKEMLNVGIEAKLLEQLSLRAGFGQYGEKEKIEDCLSGGLTLILNNISIDYAYNIHTLGDSHLVSLNLEF